MSMEDTTPIDYLSSLTTFPWLLKLALTVYSRSNVISAFSL